jgi:uncharacterized protein (DUF488 family)
MLHRQRTLLYFLHLAGGEASHLHVTKWSFLLSQEGETRGGNAFYEFVPYKLGPFSFCLFQEAAALAEQGLLTDTDQKTWKLTEVGRTAALLTPIEVRSDSRSIHEQYGRLDADSLLDDLYPRYPQYTYFSTRKILAKPPIADLAVYTAGYEGLTVDGFLDLLIQNGIRRLIDVRHNPVARRYGFHRSTLARLCGNLDIDYLHIPQLGIRSELRQELFTQGDRDRLFDQYEAKTLVEASTEVQRTADLMREKASVLMCMEAQPCQCHRSRLAEAVAEITNLPIRHLSSPWSPALLPLFKASAS